MAYCGKCGTQLNEGAKFCPKCGSPVHGDATPVSDSKNGYLTIYWEGKWALIDQTISITVNNNYVGDYSYKEGFYEKIPIDSPTMVVEIKYSFYTYRKVLKKTKVQYRKFHCLRHTFATRCIHVGMDVKSLSEILGHASINITLSTYVHSSYEVKKKYIDKI